MMRMKNKPTGLSSINGGSAGDAGEPGQMEWELRPGGMLVQRRNPDSDRNSVPAPTIRVRVKFGSIYHEIYISSQATFGDLKKMLASPTGLHHQDQKLLFKDKERDSNAYLDIAGVKDRSKIILIEDPLSQEKRYLEMRRSAKMEKASKSISQISLEVDRLAGQVSALESVVSKGGKVAEKEVLNLTELLMNQLINLDGIIADGDVKLQRKMQVRRVQKCVETLDMLKIQNSSQGSNGCEMPMQYQQRRQPNGKRAPAAAPPPLVQHHHQQQPARHSVALLPIQMHEPQQRQPPQPSRHSTSGPVVVTTNWETFDSASAPPLVSAPPTSATAAANINPAHHPPPKLNWEFFD